MEQKAILRLIIKETKMFASSKKSIEDKEEKLSADANEIKEKLAKAKDIREKDETLYEEKVAEVRKLADKRKEAYKRVQKEKLELKSAIKKAKERIITELKDNQKEIFENRNKVGKLTREDRKKLIEERRKLYREIRSDENRRLIHTTKAALKEMSDEDREKVEQARQMTKDKKARISEISKKLDIDSGDFFDKLNPKELFKRNKMIIEKVEETFQFDKIDTLNSEISEVLDKDKNKNDQQKAEEGPKEKDKQKAPQQEDNSKGKQAQNSEVKPETQPEQPSQPIQPEQQVYPDNPLYNNFPFMGEPICIGNIEIFEKEGIAAYNFGNKKGVVSLEEVRKDKKDMFKRYGIRKMVGFRASRRVNPAVIKAFEQMQNGEQMIGEYLQSIKYKERFNFNLEHDVSGLNIFQRISRNRQVKREQKCGAIVTKKQSNIDYSKMIVENEQQNDNSVLRQQRENKMDYLRADKETLAKIDNVRRETNQPIANESKNVVDKQTTQEDVTIGQ